MNKFAKALQARNKRLAAEMVPYSGMINQEGRKDNAMDKYQNDAAAKKYEIPDMSHDWQKQKRNEMGIGIYDGAADDKAPTYTDEDLLWRDSSDHSAAARRTAAIKAHSMNCTKLASLFLGDNVPESTLEAQAIDFAALSPMAVQASLNRYAETEEYAEYASGDGEDEDKGEGESETVNITTKPVKSSVEETAAIDTKKVGDAAKKLGDAQKEFQDSITGSKEDAKPEEKVDNEAVEAAADKELAEIFAGIEEEADASNSASGSTPAPADEQEEDKDAKEAISGVDDIDKAASELAAALDAEDIQSGVLDNQEQEASLEQAPTEAKTASRRGVKSIGGASMKIASAAPRTVDYSGLWKDVPSDAIF